MTMQQWHSESASAEEIIETFRIVIETKKYKKAYISHYKNGLTRYLFLQNARTLTTSTCMLSFVKTGKNYRSGL